MMMTFPKIIFIFLLLGVIQGHITSTQCSRLKSSEFTLIRFFHLSQMVLRHPTQEELGKYDPKILELMDEACRSSVDIDESIRKVNTEIYSNQMSRQTSDDEYDRLLSAIDLMLPDFIKSKDLTDTKNDLRQFRVDHPDLAKELLDKIKDKLVANELTTKHLAQLMRNFYYHWIPLARLQKALE